MRFAPSRSKLQRTALAAIAILGPAALASCESSSSSSTSSSGSGGPRQVNLAYIYPGPFTNFALEMALGAKAAADHTPGVHFTESAPANNDGNAEVQLFQTATQTSRDGMAWMTQFPWLFTFIGNSNTQLGEALADQLLKQPNTTTSCRSRPGSLPTRART